jgi:hypothetical protein
MLNQVQPTPPSPPQATVKIGNKKMTTMINGYKWSKGNSSSIADVSSSPASH